MNSLWDKIKASYDDFTVKMLVDLGKCAASEGMGIYLVGGIVRDILSGKSSMDLDFAVEGDGLKLARSFIKKYPGKLIAFQDYKNATVQLKEKGLILDFASCRQENYPYPGSPPTIKKAKLIEDLKRRDFTINAMAISLNDEDFGQIIDPFSGEKDLLLGLIRILHNRSFFDDPSRMIRAARFISRFDFILEKDTLAQAKTAVEKGINPSLSPHNFKEEMIIFLREKKVVKGLKFLKEIGLFQGEKALFICAEKMIKALGKLEKSEELDELKKPDELGNNEFFSEKSHKMWIIRAHIMGMAQGEKGEELLNKLELPKFHPRLNGDYFRKKGEISSLLTDKKRIMPSKIYEELRPFGEEIALALLAYSENEEEKARLEEFLGKNLKRKIAINGDDLIKLGIPRGPMIGEMLKKIRYQAMDREISPKEQFDLATAMAREWGKNHFSKKAESATGLPLIGLYMYINFFG